MCAPVGLWPQAGFDNTQSLCEHGTRESAGSRGVARFPVRPMKSTVSRVAVATGAVVIATLLVSDMVLDAVVAHGVGKVGGRLTGTELTMDGADLFLFSGSGAIKNLLIANPIGYSQPSAFQIGKVSVGLRPESVFQDTLQITQIRVLSPLINFEGNSITNNLADILKNVETILSNTNAPISDPAPSPGKRMHVDDLWITGARLNVAPSILGSPPQILTLPDIHLTSLGTGTNGITSAELAQILLRRLNREAIEALAESLADTDAKSSDVPIGPPQVPPQGTAPPPAQPQFPN